jgi:hypothetical protein
MPSIAVPAVSLAVSAATSAGVVTVASTTDLYPGTNAWLGLSNGNSAIRVRILKIINATTFLVRRWPTKPADEFRVAHDQENYGAPNYGVSDVSAYNGSSRISVERQTAPVDPAFSKRIVP